MKLQAKAVLAVAIMMLSFSGLNVPAHAGIAGVPSTKVFSAENDVIKVDARRHHRRHHNRRHWRHNHHRWGWYGGPVHYRPCRFFRVKVWSPRRGHYVWRQVKRCGYPL